MDTNSTIILEQLSVWHFSNFDLYNAVCQQGASRVPEPCQ